MYVVMIRHFLKNTQKLLMRQPLKQLLKGNERQEGQMVDLKLLSLSFEKMRPESWSRQRHLGAELELLKEEQVLFRLGSVRF